MRRQLIILISIYNDFKSLNILIENFNFKEIKKTHLIIINDGSKEKLNISKKNSNKFLIIKIINLKKNLGSQRAFAVGLDFIKKNYKNSKIILMDGDGEDNPKKIDKILEFSTKEKKKIITVCRLFRRENFLIKLLYEIYFLLVIILTHKIIRFGNYSLIQSSHLKNILSGNAIWFAYPAALINSSINIKKIYERKELRYIDKSKMSYRKLIEHALRIIVVFKDRILINLIIYNVICYFLFYKKVFLFFSFLFFSLFFVFYLNYFFLKEIKKKPKHLNTFISKIVVIKKFYKDA